MKPRKTAAFSIRRLGIFAVSAVIVGVVVILVARASGPLSVFEAESGNLSGGAVALPFTGASDGNLVTFKAASAPSGQDMPIGNLASWRQVYTQDFTSPSAINGSTLAPYTGIASSSGTQWATNRVAISDGMAHMSAVRDSAGAWTAGALYFGGDASRLYGKYLVRMRIPKAKGVKYAFLTWPNTGNWPTDGEIDFAEDGGGDRSGTSATTHYADANGNHGQVQRTIKADFSQWQTVGVEWTPGKLVYTLNGQAWGEVTSPAAAIPSKAMFMALQIEVGTNGNQYSVDSTTPASTTCDVDWVSIYAPK